jgi:hypothetical protein
MSATDTETRQERATRARREAEAEAAAEAQADALRCATLPGAADDPELDALFDRQLHPDRLAAIASRRGVRAGRVVDWIAGQARPEAAGLTPPDVRLRAAMALLDIIRAPQPPQDRRVPGLQVVFNLAHLPGAGRQDAITVTAEPSELPAATSAEVRQDGTQMHNKCYATLREAPKQEHQPSAAPPTADTLAPGGVTAPPAPSLLPPAAAATQAPAAGGMADFRVPSKPEGDKATLSPHPHAQVLGAGGPVLRWRDGKAEWSRAGGGQMMDERR